MKIIWKDIAVSSLIVLILYIALALIFPQKLIVQCSGDCSPEQMDILSAASNITNCSCWVTAPQPFPYYSLVRMAFIVLAGTSYYYIKNKPRSTDLLVVVLILTAVYSVYYILAPLAFSLIKQ
jgi:hypothetical protein